MQSVTSITRLFLCQHIPPANKPRNVATSDISLITRVSSSASVFDRSLCRIIIDRSSLFIFPFRKFEKSRFYYIRLSSSHPDSAVFSSFTRDFGRLLFFSRKVLCIFFFFFFLFFATRVRFFPLPTVPDLDGISIRILRVG